MLLGKSALVVILLAMVIGADGADSHGPSPEVVWSPPGAVMNGLSMRFRAERSLVGEGALALVCRVEIANLGAETAHLMLGPVSAIGVGHSIGIETELADPEGGTYWSALPGSHTLYLNTPSSMTANTELTLKPGTRFEIQILELIEAGKDSSIDWRKIRLRAVLGGSGRRFWNGRIVSQPVRFYIPFGE